MILVSLNHWKIISSPTWINLKSEHWPPAKVQCSAVYSVHCSVWTVQWLCASEFPVLTVSAVRTHWWTILVTLLIFVVTLATIGLGRGSPMHLYRYFPVIHKQLPLASCHCLSHRGPDTLRNTLLTLDLQHLGTPYLLWTSPTVEHPTHLTCP